MLPLKLRTTFSILAINMSLCIEIINLSIKECFNNNLKMIAKLATFPSEICGFSRCLEKFRNSVFFIYAEIFRNKMGEDSRKNHKHRGIIF